MPPKAQNDPPSDKEQLTDKEKDVLSTAWLYMEGKPKVDYKGLAKTLNYKNHNSVSNLVSAATRKLKALHPGAGDASPQPSPSKTNASSSKRKVKDDDDTEDEPTTPKKRAKANGKKAKAAVARDEDGELAYFKGESVDDGTV
ncbi:hypothetical protein F5B22DRAFT_643864 [Xylaria bambusicola]|uniref:uncharacterized protein n=1 Tax=Xylaria bambusicola TaxID=326684 RepID=UPI0020084425|nr:uncharacterized protein F5B22DRAFT_643864 [Xylaria bambusicola]KAI0521693.1 hypothetical protein F5B22DRAFT_643864 [Xylaria bambusicola]